MARRPNLFHAPVGARTSYVRHHGLTAYRPLGANVCEDENDGRRFLCHPHHHCEDGGCRLQNACAFGTSFFGVKENFLPVADPRMATTSTSQDTNFHTNCQSIMCKTKNRWESHRLGWAGRSGPPQRYFTPPRHCRS